MASVAPRRSKQWTAIFWCVVVALLVAAVVISFMKPPSRPTDHLYHKAIWAYRSHRLGFNIHWDSDIAHLQQSLRPFSEAERVDFYTQMAKAMSFDGVYFYEFYSLVYPDRAALRRSIAQELGSASARERARLQLLDSFLATAKEPDMFP